MSIFIDKTADTPALRILEYFIEARETDHAIGDVIVGTGLPRSTFYVAWPHVLRNAFVIPSRTVGKTRLYKLATSNTYVKLYCALFDAALKEPVSKRKVRVSFQ